MSKYEQELEKSSETSSQRNGKPKDEGRVKHVVLRTITGDVASIPIGEQLEHEAEYWCRRLDSRNRLNEVDRKKMRLEAVERLAELGIGEESLSQMGECGVVQVTIPFDESDLAPRDFKDDKSKLAVEAALEMPWEYVLSAATKPYRRFPLCVVRHIEGNNAAMERARPATSYAFIETAPADFKGFYDFTSERALVEGAFSRQKSVELPVSPTLAEIRSAFAEKPPRAVHITGVDCRLGYQLKQEVAAAEELLKPPAKSDPEESPKPGAGRPVIDENRNQPVVAGGAILSKKSSSGATASSSAKYSTSAKEGAGKSEAEKSYDVVDGLYFSKDNKAEVADFRTIAEALTGSKEKPQLIGFNCEYSGVRIAPWCVAQGAREAIGIQNSLDDEIAERFFIRFYQQWLDWRQDSLAAFIAAWEFIKPMGESVKGTGIILWLNSNLFARRSGSAGIEPSIEGIKEVHRRLKLDKVAHTQVEKLADPGKHSIKDLVQVKVKPPKLITPCMLHYGESVLNRLEFIFLNLDSDDDRPVECIREIDVEVTLKVGSEEFPYRTRVSLGKDHPKLELTNDNLVATNENPAGGIKVPLTSDLLQSASDNIRASIFVNVEWHGQTLKKHTYSVEIAPVNEWRLNEKDSLLQPMFMQPRDVAVKDIVIAGQKYLSCLEGNAKWGFRGYQADDIEPQMSAIWHALLYDFRLDYVSPPPSYNEGSQRLRTPSQVLREKRGTCIDLAMLYASCLEWIELYPVIFNSTKHTFVGCWRYDVSPEDPELVPKNAETGEEILSYTKFFENQKTGEYAKGINSIDKHPWVIKPNEFDILCDLVYQGAIIPLETVCVTEYKLYEFARSYAIGYFLEETEDSMIRSKNLEASKHDGFYPGEFESFIDVLSSRKRLQPLPLSQV